MAHGNHVASGNYGLHGTHGPLGKLMWALGKHGAHWVHHVALTGKITNFQKLRGLRN